MSDKPEKIYMSEESNCSGRYWTHSFTGSTEYIRADLAKPNGRTVKRIYCAGNKTSNLFFESEKDALIYQASTGAACGVEVWPVDIVPSQIPMEPEAKPSEWISVEKLSEAKSLLNELMTHHVVSNSTIGNFLKGYNEKDLYQRVNEFIASPPTRETP